MFRLPLSIAVVLVIAFAGAAASAVYALKATVGFGSIEIGAWQAWPVAHTRNADPYAKAHRARAGKVLLAGAEGLVFVADNDDAGQRLRGNCSYVVGGKTPPARFWSLHMTDTEDRLYSVDGPFPYAFHSHEVTRDSDGLFAIALGRSPSAGNWMALDGTPQHFRLILTLFDTPTAGSTRLEELEMPKIDRQDCDDA